MSSLRIDYNILMAEVSRLIGWGYDWASISSDNQAQLHAMVNRGLRQFYFPQPLQGQSVGHVWTFLRSSANKAISSGSYLYDMPTDYSGGATRFHWPASSYEGTNKKRDISIISFDDLLAMRANTSAANLAATPRYAAIKPYYSDPTVGQRYKLYLFPTPSATVTLTIDYVVEPDELSTTNKYPLGGLVHSDTILESCLAVAEMREDEELGVHSARFKECLAASIMADISLDAKSVPVVWQVIDTATTLELEYNDYIREVGNYFGFGSDPATWSFEQYQEVDFCVQDGYRLFINPPILPGQTTSHDWSFLRPVSQLNILQAQNEYDLPSNYGGMIGDLVITG